ncbi:hypothetical protein O7606_13075 [Micromonospora sp. WMMD882]|uniref:DUF6642 family protein n=1 Tax=Micromonospora sp. WMMD882 TaxID=3015151 RepID=UPI00248CE939|nr:hypothetical protein [Micromonospora sp. WMMD882]WBB82211.1 hypothetical protein O7606_13075 [Micromonospora sp. WMMD882]
MARGGIFCLEGQWHRDLHERGSVLPTLELLERLGRIRFIHKDAATPDELNFFLDRWLLKQYADYRVGFFAMHGTPSRLHLTDWHSVELTDVAAKMAGRCDGKRIYFGSCSVLRAPDAVLREFLAATGAALVCGFTRDVDWVESAAFETVLLDVLANGQQHNAAERRMGSAHWAPLASYLGFRVIYANGRAWRPTVRPRVPAQAAGERSDAR